jgi:hypothetical protein
MSTAATRIKLTSRVDLLSGVYGLAVSKTYYYDHRSKTEAAALALLKTCGGCVAAIPLARLAAAPHSLVMTYIPNLSPLSVAGTGADTSARQWGSWLGYLHARFAQPRRLRLARSLLPPTRATGHLVAPLSQRLLHAADVARQAITRRAFKVDGDSVHTLLHGDVTRSNAALAGSRFVMLDFEHAEIGHPVFDFAKLLDREFLYPGFESAFFEGYLDQALGPAFARIPREFLRDPWRQFLRCWQAFKAVEFSIRRRDSGYLREAAHVLRDASQRL